MKLVLISFLLSFQLLAQDAYDQIKTEFLASDFCQPHMVLSDPAARPSPVILDLLLNDLRFLNMGKGQFYRFEEFQKKWSLNHEVANETLELFTQFPELGIDNDLLNRIKLLLARSVITNLQDGGKHLNDAIKQQLLNDRIFREGSDGQPECPFLSREVFEKATLGLEKVVRKHPSKLSKDHLLTVIDYTRPSNERRLYVIDLNTKIVLHNTWVGHGGGGGTRQAKGADGVGGSPEMSNESGSNLSSSGFAIATGRNDNFEKLRYGPNLAISGVDSDNSRMASRAIVMHGWESPYYQYARIEEPNYHLDLRSYTTPKDVYSRLMKIDISRDGGIAVEAAFDELFGTLYAPRLLGVTNGCLGVPVIPVGHLDRQKRNESQLELLQRDLPGSVIFSYSGPGMKSDFL
jgi:hypothetical protein